MPSRQESERARVDFHMHDRAHSHAGGKEPLWFPVVMITLIVVSVLVSIEMIWQICHWFFPGN